MPLVNAEKFDHVIERYYLRHDEEIHAPVAGLLKSNPNLRKGIEDFLNKVLQGVGQQAVQKAVENRTETVVFKINVPKLAQQFHGKLNRNIQAQLQLSTILIAMELLLEENRFLVENHTLEYELIIDNEEEGDPEEGTEPDAPQLQQSTAMSLEDSGDPQPPKPEPAIEEPSDLDFDDDFELSPDQVQAGNVYSNGKGLHRRVDNFEEGKVGYTVVKGKGSVKEGSEGSSSFKSFAAWTAEIVEADA